MKTLFPCLLVVAFFSLPVEASPDVDESALKAAYLYNFAQFADWTQPLSGSFVFCLFAQSPLEAELQRLQPRLVHGAMPVEVRVVRSSGDLPGCHLLFLDEAERDRAAEVLRRLGKSQVLTATDAVGLAEKGWMIELRREQGRIAFDVNLSAARRAGLELSARLLRLATHVYR